MKHDIHYENLPTINRNVLVVVPTEYFLNWARKIHVNDMTLTLDKLTEESTAYLISEQDMDADAWLNYNFNTIFEIELDGWCGDPSLWPKDRSIKTFKEYFSYYFCSLAIDLGKGRINREYI